MLCCHCVVSLGGSVVCTLCPMVMDGVNTVSAQAGCLVPMTPTCVPMYVFDDESLNIDPQRLNSPQ